MRSKILPRRVPFIVALVGFTVFSVFIFHALVERPIRGTLALLYENEKVISGLPVHLNIPKINVYTRVEHVGLTSQQAMDVPKDRENVAWFELGPRPGEGGAAVIAGHYGWKGGEASAFDNLYTLRRGDKLYVVDDKGATTTFVVRESRRYDPKADARDVFGSYDGGAHLNLITCEGGLDETQSGYTDRLVVFTDKEEGSGVRQVAQVILSVFRELFIDK